MKKQAKAYRLSAEDVDYIREHFHDTPDSEIADALGISICTVKCYRTKLGLRKDPEYISRINRERAIKYGNAKRINTPQAYLKRVETVKKMLEVDRIRIKWGLEPRMKRKVRTESKEKQLQRNYLKRRGYIVDESGKVAYYTDETLRSRRLEAIPRGVKKGTIKPFYDFKPYGELDKKGA